MSQCPYCGKRLATDQTESRRLLILVWNHMHGQNMDGTRRPSPGDDECALNWNKLSDAIGTYLWGNELAKDVQKDSSAMTKEQLAKQLNGREIGKEISEPEAKLAQRAGLVVVFGASDDLVEFQGAIHDEVYACRGAATIQIDREGVLPERNQIDDDDELENFFVRRRGTLTTIKAIWNTADDKPAWTFETSLPHATFDITEDGKPYCRGIVFSMEDLPK